MRDTAQEMMRVLFFVITMFMLLGLTGTQRLSGSILQLMARLGLMLDII